MNRTTRWSAAAAAALALAGCSSNGSQNTLQAALGALGRTVAPQHARGPVLTAANVAAFKGPLMLVKIPSRKVRATLTVATRRAGYTTWSTASGQQLILQGGSIVGTRGLGADIMTTRLDGVAAALRAGQGTALRVVRRLDGANRMVARHYRCTYAATGWQQVDLVWRRQRARRVVETCQGDGAAFTDTYWIGPRGTVWRAEQWIGPGVGTLSYWRLKP